MIEITNQGLIEAIQSRAAREGKEAAEIAEDLITWAFRFQGPVEDFLAWSNINELSQKDKVFIDELIRRAKRDGVFAGILALPDREYQVVLKDDEIESAPFTDKQMQALLQIIEEKSCKTTKNS